MQVNVEYTDTFCGEANYSWVKRHVMHVLGDNVTNAKLKREAKKAMGLSGVRGEWNTHGDYMTFHPSGSCTVLFVTVT